MSVKVTSAVWDRSKAKGSDLLVLLYIADRCNDDGGGAYPSITRIAKACRLSERAAHYAIQSLVASGELSVNVNAGPKGCNLYQINLLSLGGAIVAPVQILQGCKTRQQRGAKSAPNTSVKPSPSISNEIGESTPKKPLPRNGPAQQIVATYCEVAGIDAPTNYKLAVGVAQNMVRAGIAPEDIPSLYAYVASWAHGVDLPLMLKQADKWRASKHTPSKKADLGPEPDFHADPEGWMRYRTALAERNRV